MPPETGIEQGALARETQHMSGTPVFYDGKGAICSSRRVPGD